MTPTVPIKIPKKLIEVALPLEPINVESLRRKQKAPKGWPTSFHKWWAQRPIAAARAVIFAQIVNDPSWKWELEHPGQVPPNNLRASWAASRKRLFSLMQELILWDNSANEEVLERAREEFLKSWRETCELNKDHPLAATLFHPEVLPALYDPFAGSGTIPLEAQRLGLKVLAADLNPVAVLINKAMIEIPARFSGKPPVNPNTTNINDLAGQRFQYAQGLAEDVRYYSEWMREQAVTRIGDLYPDVEITRAIAKGRPDLEALIGQKVTVTAYIWARTVRSPNPAFNHVHVPLISTYLLSTKGEGVYLEPIVNRDQYHFHIKEGRLPKDANKGTKLARGANFACLLSGTPISAEHIKAEGKAGRMGAKLMALVATTGRGRIYLPASQAQEAMALAAKPEWKPDIPISGSTQYLGIKPYGMDDFSQLFTDRQLVALTTFTDLIQEACALCKSDALRSGADDDGRNLEIGGNGATAYAGAVAMYLAFIVDRMAFYGSSLCGWLTKDNAMGKSMPQQALAMSWDFAEGNPFGKSSSDVVTCTKAICDCLSLLRPRGDAVVEQQDARTGSDIYNCLISTDPPYFDNVPYADLSDFFYVWLRRSLKPVLPHLFATIAVPKAAELVAFAYRHQDGKEGATAFFLQGMTETMKGLALRAHPAFPVTIYYAFKQSDTDEERGTSSSGWETFLQAVITAGFAISGTWPMRTEGESRMRASESNALASSIVLVCRPRPSSAKAVSRRAFLRELNEVLPEALDEMTKGCGEERSPVAPVDLSQAIIGPGMAVFSKYAAVLEADGTAMSVQTALQLINRFLAEDDFDRDTQFCLHWFEQYGWKDGKFGDADTLARAKGTSVDGVKQAGVLFAAGGVVRLRKWSEYPKDWKPDEDSRLPVWEILHQLIRVLKSDGESGAGRVIAAIQAKAEATRQLAYRLYTLCERAGWSEDARAYNEIVTSWSAIESAAAAAPVLKQASLFG
jgi:putative DNA methylase